MKIQYTYCIVLLFFGWVSITTAYSDAISSNDDKIYSDEPDYFPQGTFLVIGAFAYKDNAESFSQYAQTQGFSAKYAYHPERGYYYVYTFVSDSAVQVVEQCLALRSTSEFEDAWVFRNSGTDTIAMTDGWDNTEQEASTADTQEDSIRTMADAESIAQPIVERNEIAPPVSNLPEKKEKAELGYNVFFRTLGEGEKKVKAMVTVVDGPHAQSIKECQAYQPEVLEPDSLLTKQVQLITHAIGYRKTTFDLSLDNPTKDSTASHVSVEDGVISVRMPLEKLRKGDVQVMFNTYFYGNASVMREQSRYELEELLQYLEENPSATIKLHGHTNGNSRGVTYRYLKEHNNFFNLRRSGEYIKRGVGAKKLSQMRAETIRQYLIKQGIDESRIETKGWGGKRMLYDANSPLAKNNIRVEIEVLSE